MVDSITMLIVLCLQDSLSYFANETLNAKTKEVYLRVFLKKILTTWNVSLCGSNHSIYVMEIKGGRVKVDRVKRGSY